MRQMLLLLLLLVTQYSLAQQLDNGYAPPINDFSAILGSGMYTGGAPNGSVPDGGWQHLLVVRHGNPNNNFQLQIGSSIYENDRLYFRKIADGGLNIVNPKWVQLATRGANTFDGDQRIGLFTDNSTDIASYGNKLFFSGAFDNTDPLWMARYNNGANKSELRINIGDDYGQTEDKFVIGVNHCVDNLWHPVFTVQNDRHIIADGKLTATEIVVKQNVWADFVFHPSYQLKPLTEVEQFIKTNGHLQDIPSAAEVEQNGVNMGEMQMKLLQKVEELTLYVIELEKKIKELESK